MRLIGKEEIENISIGAALLGTGGGGDPYIGKLMAIQNLLHASISSDSLRAYLKGIRE